MFYTTPNSAYVSTEPRPRSALEIEIAGREHERRLEIERLYNLEGEGVTAQKAKLPFAVFFGLVSLLAAGAFSGLLLG